MHNHSKYLNNVQVYRGRRTEGSEQRTSFIQQEPSSTLAKETAESVLASLPGRSWKLCYIFGRVRIRDTRWTSKWIKGTRENSGMTEERRRERKKKRETRWKLADSPIALSLSVSSSFLSMSRRKNLSKVLQDARNKGNMELVWLATYKVKSRSIGGRELKLNKDN